MNQVGHCEQMIVLQQTTPETLLHILQSMHSQLEASNTNNGSHLLFKNRSDKHRSLAKAQVPV